MCSYPHIGGPPRVEEPPDGGGGAPSVGSGGAACIGGGVAWISCIGWTKFRPHWMEDIRCRSMFCCCRVSSMAIRCFSSCTTVCAMATRSRSR